MMAGDSSTVDRPVLRIDSHHHLWKYTPQEFDWIDDSMAELRRDFLLDDLKVSLRDAGISASVAVQARQTVEETRWLLSVAQQSQGVIAGVVGWLPLASDSFEQQLDQYIDEPLLKGLRHVVQGEAAGFLDGPAFLRGIGKLQGRGLTYDILIYAHQMEEATLFVDRFPNQLFVLDHIGKPNIRAGAMESWAKSIRALSERENVCCKISGMVTEADPKQWTAEELRPYFEVVLEAFGADRLMVGTDWPVLTVGCRYSQWWQIVEGWVAPLTASQRAAILAGNAIRTYKLAPDTGVRG